MVPEVESIYEFRREFANMTVIFSRPWLVPLLFFSGAVNRLNGVVYRLHLFFTTLVYFLGADNQHRGKKYILSRLLIIFCARDISFCLICYGK